MDKEELVQFLSENLNIKWKYESGELYLALVLDGKIISKIPFEQY